MSLVFRYRLLCFLFLASTLFRMVLKTAHAQTNTAQSTVLGQSPKPPPILSYIYRGYFGVQDGKIYATVVSSEIKSDDLGNIVGVKTIDKIDITPSCEIGGNPNGVKINTDNVVLDGTAYFQCLIPSHEVLFPNAPPNPSKAPFEVPAFGAASFRLNNPSSPDLQTIWSFGNLKFVADDKTHLIGQNSQVIGQNSQGYITIPTPFDLTSNPFDVNQPVLAFSGANSALFVNGMCQEQ